MSCKTKGSAGVHTETGGSTHRKGTAEVLHGRGISNCPEEVDVLVLEVLQVTLQYSKRMLF